ncbi:MAG: HAD hydrolase family protein [Ktedonobacteraceae bacterium]|jgi:soluble P-type ATPase
MIRIEIPARGVIELQHAVFDVNGTLAVDGLLLAGVVERLKVLANLLTIHILTAGTHGNLPELTQQLDYPFHIISSGEDKARFVQELGPTNVVAFGNGANDTRMLQLAAIGIAVVAAEGVATSALQAADLVALGPVDAIDMLLKPKRLVATLRG